MLALSTRSLHVEFTTDSNKKLSESVSNLVILPPSLSEVAATHIYPHSIEVNSITPGLGIHGSCVHLESRKLRGCYGAYHDELIWSLANKAVRPKPPDLYRMHQRTQSLRALNIPPAADHAYQAVASLGI